MSGDPPPEAQNERRGEMAEERPNAGTAGRPGWVLWFALGVTAVAFATAYLGSLLPLLALVAVPAGIVLLGHPRIIVILLIMVWAGPFDQSLLQRGVGGLQVTAGLVLLSAGLAWVAASRLTGRGPRRRAGGFFFLGPFVLFYVALILSLAIARAAGEPRGAVVNTGLACVAGAVYFLARDAYAGEPEVLARHLVIATGLASALVVIGVATGVDALYGRQIGYVITDGMATQAVRIDPPLLRLLSVTILMIGPGRVLAGGRWRRLRWPLLCAMILAEILSLTRSTWAPLLLATVLIPVVAVRRRRLMVLGRYVAVLTVALTVGLAGATAGTFGKQGQVVAERLYSATEASALQDNSLQDRLRENSAALKVIAEHPIAGIGLTRPFGILGSVVDPIDSDWNLYAPQQFIHQSYLGLWMWLGITGVASLGWLAVRFLTLFSRVMRETRVSRHAPVAAAAGLVVLAISSTFQTNLMYPPAHLAVGLGLAYLETWVRQAAASRTPDVRPTERRPLWVDRMAGGSVPQSYLRLPE